MAALGSSAPHAPYATSGLTCDNAGVTEIDGDTSPIERAGTAQEIAEVLKIPASTVRRYAHEGAIVALGRRKGRAVYDGRAVARVRHARRVANDA